MSPPNSFRDVIGLWRSPGAMADEAGVSRASARKWEQRDSIPAEWWSAVLATETAQGNGLSAELFAELAARSGTQRESVEARA